MGIDVIGGVILVDDGRNALAQAQATGKKIQPKFYRQSEQDLVLDPALSASDIVGWRAHDIDLVGVENNSTVAFRMDCPIEEATNYTRLLGIYLEDGTLYAVAKPAYALPPSVRQVFIPKVAVNQQIKYMNFNYLPVDVADRQLQQASAVARLGVMIIESKKKMTDFFSMLHALSKKLSSVELRLDRRVDITKELLKKEVHETKLTMMGNTARLGSIMVESNQKLRRR